MLHDPLVATKLHIPPTRRELVSRPRLIERLRTRGGFPRALTLISAPAGFGKTTLVSKWVYAMGTDAPPIAALGTDALPIAALGTDALPIAVAWLSLDGGDNDPARWPFPPAEQGQGPQPQYRWQTKRT